MIPPIAITLTIKVRAPIGVDVPAIDDFVEEIRDEVERALPGALDVELNDWTSGGGEAW